MCCCYIHRHNIFIKEFFANKGGILRVTKIFGVTSNRWKSYQWNDWYIC